MKPPAVLSELIALDRLETEHAALQREASILMDRARQWYRRVQDAEAEATEAEQGRLIATAYIAQRDLAIILNQLTRAQAGLIHHDDPRWHAARHVIGECDDGDLACSRVAA